MSVVRTERTKLTATAINNLALAFAVAGFVAPLVGYSFGLTSAPPVGVTTFLFSLIWLTVAVALHLLARGYLRRLEP